VYSGYISAIVHTGNRHFRLLTTHLQGPVLTDPSAPLIQAAQAQELIQELRNSTVPVILAGDFNSDAIPGTRPGPDNTGTAAMIQAAGYTDVTTALGPTWPLYSEDALPPAPYYGHAFPWERIDLIFAQGLTVLDAERILAPNVAVNAWPYYGSDHAGVLATFAW
jgi:endonuclease/exonuclease/phosphatase (EEP) superfamily protein YafD